MGSEMAQAWVEGVEVLIKAGEQVREVQRETSGGRLLSRVILASLGNLGSK